MIYPSEAEIAREMEAYPQFKGRPDVCIRRIRDRAKIKAMRQRKVIYV